MPENFGRYEVKSELGRGGMATVFHAFDPRFKRDVALKVLPREFLHDPTFRVRFEREAQTIAALEHSAIVPVYDYGEDHGQPYLVMRYLPGGTLTQRMEQGPLPFDEVIRVTQHLAPALDEAHSRGIVHRDLKPDNILFDQRNTPFIADFGIVKLSEGGKAITTGNAVIGTPAYMSPEQAHGEVEIDGRSDIYALGVILYQMLSGELPYQATTPVGLVMKHLMEPVPRILETNPGLPPVCDAVITRSMAKNPNDRFSTATELSAALLGKGSKLPAPTPASQNRVDTPLKTDADITCPNCQAINPNTLRHCATCGQRLLIDCVRCHMANSADAIQCTNCGTNLQSAEQYRRELEENRRRVQQERDKALQQKQARQLQDKIQRLAKDLSVPSKHQFTIYQLKQIGEPAINTLVDTLLNSSSQNARLGAARALAEICAGPDVKTLSKARAAKGFIKALNDPEPAVRFHSAKALGNFEGKQAQLAVEPLGALLKDKNEDVRKQARVSLEKIGGPRAQEILDQSKGFMGWLKG